MKKTVIITLFVLVPFASCIPPHNLTGSGWMFGNGKRKEIVHTAKQYLGVKYKHGGESPGGFDCSGFVMYVYKKNGVDMPRATKQQYHDGHKVTLAKAQPADLVFFKIRGSKISHVGIYLGGNKFIHSPRTGKTVAIESMKNPYWHKRIVAIKTYL